MKGESSRREVIGSAELSSGVQHDRGEDVDDSESEEDAWEIGYGTRAARSMPTSPSMALGCASRFERRSERRSERR